jgi:UDP-glucose:(heptosyl)LPS alpha-1,3-glucosyltransferase
MEKDQYTGRRYRRLIALTPQVKEDLMRFYGVADEDAIVIPNGFSPEEFNLSQCRQMREEVRRRLGYSTDDRVVLFVGNEAERKGLPTLLRAMVRLADERIKLLVVGRFRLRRYAVEATRLGINRRVYFAGPNDKIAPFYAATDVLALPTWYEAWGLVIIEALASGLPVVASRLAGAAVAIRERETGILLDDPGDVEELAVALRSVLDGSHASAETISSSVSAYAWPELMQPYEMALREALRPVEKFTAI